MDEEQVVRAERSLMKPARARPEWRHLVRWLIKLRGSPQAIALGAAIGVFVAFTPSIGFQTVIALILATLLNANRPAAMALVWITNPLTIPPCFLLTYCVGSLFWPGPSPATVSHEIRNAIAIAGRHDFWEMHDQFTAFVGIGRDVLIPLLIGGIVVGIILGSVMYVLTLGAVKTYRQHRAARRGRRPLAGDSADPSQKPMRRGACVPNVNDRQLHRGKDR